jgi:pimeloyl-ACP methyl ester carboxylesterase
MAFAESNDQVRIEYEIFGTGSLPVILLHGWGGSARYWREMLAHLQLSNFRLIALSYRGHGMSDKPENGYTLDQIASDVLAVADAANAMRFVLVGFSMSGKFAQYIAATCPKRVIGMALIAPVPASEFPVPPEMAKSWCDAQADREAAYKQILAPFTHIPVRQDLVEAFLDEFAQASRVALRETLNLCSASFATRLHGIELPTLVLAGDFDPLLSPDLLRNTILAQLPGAQ